MTRLAISVGSVLRPAGETVFRFARRLPLLGLMIDAWLAYSRDQMAILAASLGYYFLLSLFPILLLLIAALSPLISSDAVIREAVRFAQLYVPSVGVDLGPILRQAVNARGAVTVIAVLGLFWSASGVFDVIQLALDRAWHVTTRRPIWRQRLVSLTTVLGIGVLFGASFGMSTLTHFGFPSPRTHQNEILSVVGPLVNTLLGVFLFSFFFKFLPHANVRWQHVWRAAIITSFAWEIAKVGFSFYILNYAKLNLVYGSVGAFIALLTWGYLTAAILLYGAEIAALDWKRERAGHA